MWTLIIFALFAVGICVAALVRGASAGDTGAHKFLDTRPEGHDSRHRDAT